MAARDSRKISVSFMILYLLIDIGLVIGFYDYFTIYGLTMPAHSAKGLGALVIITIFTNALLLKEFKIYFNAEK